MSTLHDVRRYDPAKGRWPWDLAAIEDALLTRGFRPERVQPDPAVSFTAVSLRAHCPGCYPGVGLGWVEETEPTLSVGAVLGPVCTACDLPPEAILGAVGLFPVPARRDHRLPPALPTGPPRLGVPRIFVPRAA